MNQKVVKSFLLLFSIFISTAGLGTHARTAVITYKHVEGYTYAITIETYTYSPSPADRPELEIQWGDGTSAMLPRTYMLDVTPTIRKNLYEGEHTFSGEGSYLMSMEDPNRNYGIVNIPNSINQPEFVETLLVINDEAGPNNSVIFETIPALQVNNGWPFEYNCGAIDTDVDHLTYELIPCKGMNGLPIEGYEIPYATHEFKMDAENGQITWDWPYIQGEYIIAAKITEWRNGKVMGFVTREFQFIVSNQDESPPEIESITDTAVFYDHEVNINVKALAPGQNVSLDVRGYALGIQNPPLFNAVTAADSCTSVLHWETKLEHARAQPYYFYLISTAYPTYAPSLVTTTVKCLEIRVDFYAGEEEILSQNDQAKVNLNTSVDRYLHVRLNRPSAGILQVRIFSLNGKQVAAFTNQEKHSRTIKFDLASLHRGIYLISIGNEEEIVYSGKIVKR